MEEKKAILLNDDQLEKVNGGVLEDSGKEYLDNLIRNIKGDEPVHPSDLIRKIEKMPQWFFASEIGENATMEEVSEYIYQNWDKF